jgi:hypothetical protein
MDRDPVRRRRDAAPRRSTASLARIADRYCSDRAA